MQESLARLSTKQEALLGAYSPRFGTITWIEDGENPLVEIKNGNQRCVTSLRKLIKDVNTLPKAQHFKPRAAGLIVIRSYKGQIKGYGLPEGRLSHPAEVIRLEARLEMVA